VRRLHPILSTDESQFGVDFHDGLWRVWRAKGGRFDDAFVTEDDHYGGGSVMVSGGISSDGTADLHVVRGTMTGAKYRDEIPHPVVQPIAGPIGLDFILMDNNAHPHRAAIVNE
jgi:hypothetical protein